MVKKEKKEEIIDATFLDAKGKVINVKDIISKDDCWIGPKKDRWILTLKAVQVIAKIAGISKTFEVEESEHIVPDYKNELAYIVRVKIHCRACASKPNPEDCVHGERSLTATGEANRINCPYRGRDYLRKMAEKRAYVIAVLEHLDLYSVIYCEEEAESFSPKKEPKIMPGTKAFEELIQEINAILESKDTKELLKVGRKIKAGKKIGKYSPLQLEYLRDLFNVTHAKKLNNF